MSYAGCCAAIRDMDLSPVVHLIDMPTSILAGERDPPTPPVPGQAIATAISGARYASLDAAHLSNLERPEGFTRLIADFLADR